MDFAIFIMMLVWLLLVPINAKRLSKIGKTQFIQWIIAELLLFSTIIIVFIACWEGAILTKQIFAPAILNTEFIKIDLDSPATLRGIIFMFFIFLCPFMIFHNIGIPGLRDLHQNCKEMRDQSKKPNFKTKNG